MIMEAELMCLMAIAAGRYSGKNWHDLTDSDRNNVKFLEEKGLIETKETADGFVGKSTIS